MVVIIYLPMPVADETHYYNTVPVQVVHVHFEAHESAPLTVSLELYTYRYVLERAVFGSILVACMHTQKCWNACHFSRYTS